NGSGTNPANSSATTVSSGDVTAYANVGPGSTLTLGANLALSGGLDLYGALNGTGNVTVGGTFGWYGGTAGGSGPMAVTGGVIINSTGNGTTSTLDGRTLTANGGVTWSGGNITLQNGAALVVAPGTTFTDGTGGAGSFVNGGGAGSKLVVNGTYTPGGSGLTIPGGITLGGTGTVGGAVHVQSGATVAPGNSVGTLTVGPTTFSGGSTYSVELGTANAGGPGSNTSDVLNVSGVLNFLTGSGVFVDVSTVPGGSGAFAVGTTYEYTIAATTG